MKIQNLATDLLEKVSMLNKRIEKSLRGYWDSVYSELTKRRIRATDRLMQVKGIGIAEKKDELEAKRSIDELEGQYLKIKEGALDNPVFRFK